MNRQKYILGQAYPKEDFVVLLNSILVVGGLFW